MIVHDTYPKWHNARINPTDDDTTQLKSQPPMLMTAMLRRVGLNELLGVVVRHHTA